MGTLRRGLVHSLIVLKQPALYTQTRTVVITNFKAPYLILAAQVIFKYN